MYRSLQPMVVFTTSSAIGARFFYECPLNRRHEIAFDGWSALAMSSRGRIPSRYAAAWDAIDDVQTTGLEGRLVAASGAGIEVLGLSPNTAIGDHVDVVSSDGTVMPAEVIAFRDGTATAMTFSSSPRLQSGGIVRGTLGGRRSTLSVSDSWIGRVIDPFGNPLDNGGKLSKGPKALPLRAAPPAATSRARLGSRLSLGIRALNVFVPCRAGQRFGLFAGAGVGKSTLIAMLGRHTECDLVVTALVGERGREVRDFIEDGLEAGVMDKSIFVVSTSDESPLCRREAVYSAMTICEYFRDKMLNVLLIVDSITRFCHALREIGLAAGEIPTSRGYPSSVFAELPRLVERAGPGAQRLTRSGYITAFFSILLEGEDLNEPIADSLRGLLDGHIILDRRVNERGRYPSVDLLRSLSRCAPECYDEIEFASVSRAKQILATYADVFDLLRLGAYRRGADVAADEAVDLGPAIEDAMHQAKGENCDVDESFQRLRRALQTR